jgi:general stress protein 26
MSEIKELHGEEGTKKIAELVKEIRICMMTTSDGKGGFDSRPMATQESDFDGTVWFLTQAGSGKVREIESDDHVGLLYSKPSDASYVTMKGRASVGRDKQKIHELWNPMYRAWFPEGETDASILVVRVKVDEAQYWESPGGKLVMGVKYLAAAITGGKVQVGATGKVTM